MLNYEIVFLVYMDACGFISVTNMGPYLCIWAILDAYGCILVTNMGPRIATRNLSTVGDFQWGPSR